MTGLGPEPGAVVDDTLLVANRSMLLLSKGLTTSLPDEAVDCLSFAAVTVDKSSKSATVNSAN